MAAEWLFIWMCSFMSFQNKFTCECLSALGTTVGSFICVWSWLMCLQNIFSCECLVTFRAAEWPFFCVCSSMVLQMIFHFKLLVTLRAAVKLISWYHCQVMLAHIYKSQDSKWYYWLRHALLQGYLHVVHNCSDFFRFINRQEYKQNVRVEMLYPKGGKVLHIPKRGGIPLRESWLQHPAIPYFFSSLSE